MRRILIAAGIGAAVLAVGLPVLSILALRWVPPPVPAFMAEKWAKAKLTGEERFRLRYRWTGWDGISPHARIAVVAAEDKNFPRHSGFDVEAIEEAWEEHEQGGRLRGASTISQQVARNVFLWPGRSFVRKGLE